MYVVDARYARRTGCMGPDDIFAELSVEDEDGRQLYLTYACTAEDVYSVCTKSVFDAIVNDDEGDDFPDLEEEYMGIDESKESRYYPCFKQLEKMVQLLMKMPPANEANKKPAKRRK